MNTKRVIFFVIVLVMIHFSIVVGESLFAARVWLDRTLSGESQSVIMCELPEFTNNIARGLGMSPTDSRNAQKEVYRFYCGE